ncbi:hypothetical protein Syun_012028 [Stephania yunnanensis]|uniref:Uncharacterized protein n=1 Tax=Stephania yunnanensis TaxID=152371 RepID=A0AAP0PEW6_9MAGN
MTNNIQNNSKSSVNDTESESHVSKSYFCNGLGAEVAEDEARFYASLRELKGLRSQLYFAADYYKSSFLKAKQRTMVMENTKEYICRAMVTVVDHLGSVYTNLEYRLHEPNIFSDTPLRIDCLKQRLLTCQSHAQNLVLSNLRLDGDLQRYNSNYILPKNSEVEKSNVVPRDIGKYVAPKFCYKLKKEGVPPLIRSNSRKSSSLISKLFPLRNGVKKLGSDSASVPCRSQEITIPRSPRNYSFFSQDTSKLKRKNKIEESKSLGSKNKPYRFY